MSTAFDFNLRLLIGFLLPHGKTSKYIFFLQGSWNVLYIAFDLFITHPIWRSSVYMLGPTCSACMKLYFFIIPCLRTSSTAAVSSSFRNWLSFAIFSPFSRKFWVAVSTEAAKTWAFLERPFFLLDGPLLLEFTRVVTYERNNKLFNSKKYFSVKTFWQETYSLKFLKVNYATVLWPKSFHI